MAAAPMIVDIDRLDRHGEAFVGAIDAKVLALDDASRELFPSWSDLRYDLFVQRIDNELLVRGAVEMDFRCVCCRCAQRFDWRAREEHLTFVMEIDDAPDCFVDLTAELREAILLLLPSHPLCRDSCRGLCAGCGADLNRGPCKCPPKADICWSVLDGLDCIEPSEDDNVT